METGNSWMKDTSKFMDIRCLTEQLAPRPGILPPNPLCQSRHWEATKWPQDEAGVRWSSGKKNNSNQVGKGRDCVPAPTWMLCHTNAWEEQTEDGKLLQPILAQQNTPHSPKHEQQCALQCRQPTSVPLTMDQEPHSRLVPAWTNSLSLYKSSKIQILTSATTESLAPIPI